MGAANRKDIGRGRRSNTDGKIRQSYSGINNFAHVGRGLQGTSAGSAGVSTSSVTFPLTPTIVDVSPGATINIDLSAVTAHHTKITLTENLTITLSSPPATGSRIRSTLEFVQDATGGWTVTFPGSVTTPPTVPSTALDRTVYEIQTIDGGITYDIYESLITNTVAGSGANTALDNLITTNINANLIPQAGKTLGASGQEWSKIWATKLEFNTAGALSGTGPEIIGEANGLILGGNTTITNRIAGTAYMQVTVNGVEVVGTMDCDNLQIDTTANTPAIPGYFQNDGTDVKVYSGGAVRNFSDISGTVALNTDLSNLTTTAANLSINPTSAGSLDLGSDANYWDQVKAQEIKFLGSKALPSGTATEISQFTGGDMQIATSNNNIKFYIAGNFVGNFQSTGISNIVDFGVKHIQLGVETSPPGVNGRMSSDGTDVRVYSGGSLRNMSDIGVAAGGANVNLDNLSTTSINQNLLPQAGKLLGNSGNIWSSAFMNSLKLGTAGSIDATINQIIGTTGGIDFNVPTLLGYDFLVAGSSIGTISTTGTVTFPNFIVSTSINLNDAVSYPGANGSIYREGSDVKVFTGGSELNLSSIGSGGADAALSNLASVAINTSLLPASDDSIDLGSGTKQWRDLYVDGTAHIDTLAATTISGSVAFIGASVSINSGTILLGDSTADNLVITARIDSDMDPDNDDTYDLGSSSLQWRNLYIDGTANIDTLSGVGACNTNLLPTNDTYNMGGASNRWHEMYVNDFLDVLENYTSGFAPSGQTDRARLFCVNNGVKTQLRVKFQSGGSILLAEEP